MRVVEAQQYLSVHRERQRRLRAVFPPVEELTPELGRALQQLAALNLESLIGAVREKRQ